MTAVLRGSLVHYSPGHAQLPCKIFDKIVEDRGHYRAVCRQVVVGYGSSLERADLWGVRGGAGQIDVYPAEGDR